MRNKMRNLLFILILLITISCSHKVIYDEYYISNYENNSLKSETYHTDLSYIKYNKLFKNVKIHYLNKTYKYKIESFNYLYPKSFIFNFRKNKIGKQIILTNGIYLKMLNDGKSYINIPTENDDLTDTLIIFKQIK